MWEELKDNIWRLISGAAIAIGGYLKINFVRKQDLKYVETQIEILDDRTKDQKKDLENLLEKHMDLRRELNQNQKFDRGKIEDLESDIKHILEKL